MEKPVKFPKPKLQYLLSLECEIQDTVDLGKGKQIQRIKGGTVKGSILGTVREGSGQWLEPDRNGNTLMEGKYTLETGDKKILPLDVTGIMTPEGQLKLHVSFHSGHKKYRHLNSRIVIAVGQRTEDTCRMDLYMLADREVPERKDAFFHKPELEHLYYIRVAVGDVLMAGKRPQGLHLVIPIQGGCFEGRRLRGTVANAGADWNDMAVGIPMVSHVSTRYLLQTDDGAHIFLYTDGHMRMGIPGMLAMLRKKPDPLKTYFKQHMTFYTGDSRYSWLNSALCAATISPTPDLNICYDAYCITL